MTARRNVARAVATVLGALIVLVAALQGTALAAAPELTIQPFPGNATDSQTPVFSGTTNDVRDELTSAFDPVTLDIYAGGSFVQASTADAPAQTGLSEDTWEITPATPLEQGEYTAVAEQTNLETGSGTSAPPVTFTVETRPVVTLVSPAENAVLKASEPTLSGQAEGAAWDEPVMVLVHKGGSTAGTIVASESVSVSAGAWSYSPSLSDGVYTAQATQADEVGDTGTSTAVTFTVDTTAPSVTLTSPEEGALVTVSGPTLTGAAAAAAWDESTATVTIREGGSLNGEVVALEHVPVSAGAWAYSVPHLSDGIYTAQASQGDEAGHIGTSNAVTFTVDTEAPVVTLTSPTEGAFVKTSTPTVSGQGGAAPWDAQRLAVKIYEGTSTTGSVVASSSGVSVKGGTWSYVPSHLNDGVYTAQAEQGDEAGHDGVSNAVTFTVDTTPPALTLETPQNGEVLATSRPTFSGLAGHATGDHSLVTVKLYQGSSVSGSPTQTLTVASETGGWTTAGSGPALANGVYTARAEQSDEAGNRTERTVTFTIATNSPIVTLETPGFEVRETHLLAGATPSFSGSGGTAPEDAKFVTVKLYSGTSASGRPVRTVEGSLIGSDWKAGPVEALPDGVYTAQAEQADMAPSTQAGVSSAVTFTVEARSPQVTLTSPVNGSSTYISSQTVGGNAGTEEADLPGITVRLYAGSTVIGQRSLEAVSVEASAGAWSGAFGGLTPGTYTAQAEQSDDLGNVGRSEAVTFTVLTPATPATTTPSPPAASFKWIPADPQAGELVTLASNSSAGSSPIASYAWSLAGNSVFTRGESTLTTSFATPGWHTVQLQVTDADGLSSTVAEKVAVATATVPLMQPFPVVRMAGSFTTSGARISLLAALAPVGANVTITCHGKGCPTKSQAFVATAGAKSKSGTVEITFKRFERYLRSGVVMEIWISKHGQIGKFTRFVIRRDKSPTRVDQCVNPTGTVPIVCPS